MIPKIIHQLWVGPKAPPTEMMNTWKEHNPDWEYMFWNEDSIKEHFPNGLHNQEQYDRMPEWNGKCDIARYEILKKFGGFFMDADSVCLRPLEDYFLDNDSFSCYENEFLRGQLVAAGYLGCIKDCRLMDLLIGKIHHLKGNELHPQAGVPEGTHNDLMAWKTVGPVLLTQTIFELKYRDIAIYPSFYFIPNHYTKQFNYEGPFKPYADQFWGSTVTNQGKVGMQYG